MLFDENISVYQWLTIPSDIRNQLIDIFDIPMSSNTIVEDNQVVSDGHTTEDLFAITEEKCLAYLGGAFKGDSLHVLLGKIIEGLQEPEETEIEEGGITPEGEVIPEITNVKTTTNVKKRTTKK